MQEQENKGRAWILSARIAGSIPDGKWRGRQREKTISSLLFLCCFEILQEKQILHIGILRKNSLQFLSLLAKSVCVTLARSNNCVISRSFFSAHSLKCITYQIWLSCRQKDPFAARDYIQLPALGQSWVAVPPKMAGFEIRNSTTRSRCKTWCVQSLTWWDARPNLICLSQNKNQARTLGLLSLSVSK